MDNIFIGCSVVAVKELARQPALMDNLSIRWSVVAVKELAGHLALMEETNWKHFANYIGFTKQEIKSKLQVYQQLISFRCARTSRPQL